MNLRQRTITALRHEQPNKVPLLMGEALWREFIKPRVHRMYQPAQTFGKFVFIHSCGKVNSLFPELMDVYGMKREYGRRLSFYGGIRTQRVRPYGTGKQVRSEVTELLRRIGEVGGYIAAPAHSIPGDARPENVAPMIDFLQNQ